MIETKLYNKINIRHQPGFTIIEIMVTLVILSILATFSIGYFSQYREKSQLAIAQTMLNIYAQELVAFELKGHRFPENNNEYNVFLKQLKFDPNNDPQYNTYFLIQPNFNTNYLLAVPQRKHNYKSYVQMSLDDFSMDICREAPTLYQAKGGICRRTISPTHLSQ
ncbi:MAG: prepilin-type N-terminal cleavage/methylation domain-containing protein [Neisseriaceae bacterium]|nr:MAG: prepilin-type N-terminal cleavage/methylation domain-containing protein [Neisseriaceae bacterium]